MNEIVAQKLRPAERARRLRATLRQVTGSIGPRYAPKNHEFRTKSPGLTASPVHSHRDHPA